MWKNSLTRYGLIARLLHWLMVPLLLGLVVFGLWMTHLTYYDSWYHRAPPIHEGLGLLAFMLFLIRFVWHRWDPPPPLAMTMKPWEKTAARLTHLSLYTLMGVLPVTGYLITTAKGQSVAFFGWFSVPAIMLRRQGMEDLAGKIHLVLGIFLIVLVFVHLLAALKHHFLTKDDTLIRMTGSFAVFRSQFFSESNK